MNDLETELRQYCPYAVDAQRHRNAQRAALLTAFGTPLVASAASVKAVATSTAASSTGSTSSIAATAIAVAACLTLGGGGVAWWALQGQVATRPPEAEASDATIRVAQRKATAVVVEPKLTATSGRFTTQFFRDGKLVVSSPGWFDGAVSRTGKPGGYSVMDGESGVTIEVFDAERRAVRYRLSPPANDDQAQQVARYGGGLIGSMRWMLDPKNRAYFETPEAKAKGTRREVIKQRTSRGIRVGVRITSPAMSSTVLANPRTGRPERFEVILGNKPDNKVVTTEFEFGVAVDPALLSTDPPEGYTLDDRTSSE